MKNKYFTPEAVQARIEEKIEKYYNAFKDEDVRRTLEQMPKNAETLAIIEAELETVVEGLSGESSHERWFNFQQALNFMIKDPKNNDLEEK